MKYFFFSILLSYTVTSNCQEIQFAEPFEISQGGIEGVSALDVADFNEDGLLDIAIFDGGAHSGGRTKAVWYEQKSDNSWVQHEFRHDDIIGTNDKNDFVGAMKCGDIDNDGDADLIVSVDGHKVGPILLYGFINPGKSKVNQPWPKIVITTIEGWHANDMVLKDMDGDGKTDIVIRHKEPHEVKIIFQESLESWTSKYIGTLNGEGLSVGDLNRDGNPDISVSGHWFKAPDNPRTMKYQEFIYTSYSNIATKEAIGDLNMDGRPDIVLSPAEAFKYYGVPGDIHELAWFEGPKNAEKVSSWKKHVIESNQNDLSFVRLGDFDNDGDLDIASARTWRGTYIRIYLNDNGKFEKSYTVVEEKGIYSGAVADMDGDGDLDIVGEETYSNNSRPYYYENLLID